MEKSQVTIKDIANCLNISLSTVSRALRDHPDISPETKKRVQALASELDYHPNGIAQSLKKKRTNTIGVIVPEIKHNFFSSALNGIEDVTYAASYTIIVCKSNEDFEREVVNTRALVSNRVAGLIVSISQTTSNVDHFKNLQKRGIPIVFFDRTYDDIDASKVLVDDCQGAFEAVEHLIKAGYERIAHIAGPKHLSISKKRYEGYCLALEKHNLPVKENYVVHGGLQEEDGLLGFQKFLQNEELPDAIFAINDPVAVGVYIQIKKNGLKIPDDVALVGFSDDPVSALIEPPLTTVSQPAYELGATAARLLMEEIDSKDNHFIRRTKTLKTKLIIRRSS